MIIHNLCGRIQLRNASSCGDRLTLKLLFFEKQKFHLHGHVVCSTKPGSSISVNILPLDGEKDEYVYSGSALSGSVTFSSRTEKTTSSLAEREKSIKKIILTQDQPWCIVENEQIWPSKQITHSQNHDLCNEHKHRWQRWVWVWLLCQRPICHLLNTPAPSTASQTESTPRLKSFLNKIKIKIIENTINDQFRQNAKDGHSDHFSGQIAFAFRPFAQQLRWPLQRFSSHALLL